MFNFPWTNFHELNLDWILSVVKEAKEVFDDGRSDIDYAVSTADEAKTIATQAATASIPDNSVSTAKIQDYAVNNTKLSNYSITDSKLQNGCVTTAKLADGCVTNVKLDSTTQTLLTNLQNTDNNRFAQFNNETLSDLYTRVSTYGYTVFGCSGTFTGRLTNNDASTQGFGFCVKTPAGFAEGLVYVTGNATLYACRVDGSGAATIVKKIQFISI